MATTFVRYRFDPTVPMTEVQATLQLARFATESMHGEERLRLEARTRLDAERCECVIDTSTDVGRTLAVVFGGYVRREFGDHHVTMTRSAALVDTLAGSMP